MWTLIGILVFCLVVVIVVEVVDHYKGDKDSIHDDYMY